MRGISFTHPPPLEYRRKVKQSEKGCLTFLFYQRGRRMNRKSTDACIQNCIDILVKAESQKHYGFFYDSHNKVQNAERFIAYVTQYDYTNLNAVSVITAFSRYCGCGVGKFKACLHTYIEEQEASLWQSLSMEKIPTEAELIAYILDTHLEGIIAGVEQYVNKPPKSFTAMLWNPVIDRWNKKWESECVFYAKFYDVHNRVVETSPYAARDFILELADGKLYENPGRYSRYVLFIKTPFQDAPAIYTIGGSVGVEHIYRSSAGEWKAVYYDHMDQEIVSFTGDAYMDKKCLSRNMRERNAIYCVLCCRHAPDADFTVQLYQSNKYFNSMDAVLAIEGDIINHYSFERHIDTCTEEWKAVLYDDQDRAVMTYVSHSKMHEKHLYKNMVANGCKYYILYYRSGPHEEFARC